VEHEVGRFSHWLDSLELTPTIVALRNRFDDIRRAELARAVSGWKGLSAEDEKRLDALTVAIMNKLLHQPTSALKKAGQGGRVDLHVDSLRELFDLKTASQEQDELELEDE